MYALWEAMEEVWVKKGHNKLAQDSSGSEKQIPSKRA